MTRIRKLRRLISEIDYAQRRMFELRTGVQLTATDQIADLERTYARPSHTH